MLFPRPHNSDFDSYTTLALLIQDPHVFMAEELLGRGGVEVGNGNPLPGSSQILEKLNNGCADVIRRRVPPDFFVGMSLGLMDP
jgi:hypothetical protein